MPDDVATSSSVTSESRRERDRPPPDASRRLTVELVCYARSVAGIQWDRMQSGTLGEQLNPWGVELYKTLRTITPATAVEQSAYDTWLAQTSVREAARHDRVHGAVGVIPDPLWLVLFFADSGERAIVQGLLMGSVIAVLTSLLLLLGYLDNPFHDHIGGLRPVAMERTFEVIDQELAVVHQQTPPPCDERGVAR